MRPDQLQRLGDLAERLADSFLVEADPGEWPGDGCPPAELTQQLRGDRYWCKKNAMATGGVLRFTLDLIDRKEGVKDDDHGAAGDDLDRRINEAERRASAAVDQALRRAKDRAYGGRASAKR